MSVSSILISIRTTDRKINVMTKSFSLIQLTLVCKFRRIFLCPCLITTHLDKEMKREWIFSGSSQFEIRSLANVNAGWQGELSRANKGKKTYRGPFFEVLECRPCRSLLTKKQHREIYQSAQMYFSSFWKKTTNESSPKICTTSAAKTCPRWKYCHHGRWQTFECTNENAVGEKERFHF